jgi:para-aminobenzoate synthetase component I
MLPLIQCFDLPGPTAAIVADLARWPGVVWLQSTHLGQGRYSFLAANPFLIFRSSGACGEIATATRSNVVYGNPWQILEDLLSRYQIEDEAEYPFPLGGCFGFWGYELKNFVEPKLSRRLLRDLPLPDCWTGFFDSLLIFDHTLKKQWMVSTGMRPDGVLDPAQAQRQLTWWEKYLDNPHRKPELSTFSSTVNPAAESRENLPPSSAHTPEAAPLDSWFSADLPSAIRPVSNLNREAFINRVERAQRYIRQGDIYQVNLSHRVSAPRTCGSWELFERLSAVSPAPFSGFLNAGDFQLVSSSPELFLRIRGSQIRTQPIKGTRPRSSDPQADDRLRRELLASTKEKAELLMITDLLRNDLGRVCEFGSVQTPELFRLKQYAQVQHLVSTVDGHLRSEVTHLQALAQCFPGGSITGAPKFRAMEIIEELEPVQRGPYTGCLGYLGFNRESQLSILIRTAICLHNQICFPVGAGIVDASQPEAEYAETLAKAAGFLAVIQPTTHDYLSQRQVYA